MWGQSKQATAATVSLAYLTVGALLGVWSIIWFIYLNRHGANDGVFLLCYGTFFSGLVLIAIGLVVGPLGRSARAAEVPATPQVVATPVATAVPGVTDNGIAPVPATVPVQQSPVTVPTPVAPATTAS